MKNSLLAFLLACSLLFFGCSKPEVETTSEPKHSATIVNDKNQKIGSAIFTETSEGVKVKIDVSRLSSGKHGIHIHETGKCLAPDFQSAGSHFNPHKKKHGKENPQGFHVGDLDNIEINLKGNGQTTQTLPNLTLQTGKTHSLLKNGGTAIVIHEKPDDYKTDPAGAAGKRIACGVIK